MDRSFLSDAAVITASRRFVCIRLLSYENKEEAALLKSLGGTRSGEAENTLCCVLAPDGKRRLTAVRRGPREIFRSAANMARELESLAAGFTPRATDDVSELPLVVGVRLAVNVAACDKQPLVLFLDSDPRIDTALRRLAWDKEFVGRFVFAKASAKELAAIKGAKPGVGLVVVQSDPFGIEGEAIAQAPARSVETDGAACLREGLVAFKRGAGDFWTHVAEGQRRGVFWETQTPVTDPMEFRAREKGRLKRP
ncbi:MAG: hypothetical protein U0793_26975 [Gemmataceae bacterium]